MSSLSPDAILPAQSLTTDDKSVLPSTESFCFQEQKEIQNSPIILFRKQAGNAWITIQRESSGEVKGLIEQLNGSPFCLPIKGIPCSLAMQRVQKIKNTLNSSQLTFNNFFIEVIPNLKRKAIE